MGRRPRKRELRDTTVKCPYCGFETGYILLPDHDRVCEKKNVFLAKQERQRFKRAKYYKLKNEIQRKRLEMKTLVTIRCSTGDRTKIPLGVFAQQSARLRRLINSGRFSTEITVPFSSQIMDHIRTFCYFFDYKNELDNEESNESFGLDALNNLVKIPGVLAVFQLACAAEYFEIEVLVGRCVKEISFHIRKKNFNEIREMLHLPAQLSVEEISVMSKVRPGYDTA